MKLLRTLAFSAILATPAASPAAEGNLLRTMPHGVYECAIPGDAGTMVWEPVDGAGFVISQTSAYRTDSGRGTYLLKGKELLITSGPKKGERYLRTGDAELKLLEENGNPGRLICVKVASRH